MFSTLSSAGISPVLYPERGSDDDERSAGSSVLGRVVWWPLDEIISLGGLAGCESLSQSMAFFNVL